MRSQPREVVVVGAGPAGAAAALFLRQLGHDVLVLDEARFPREKVCGESVSPEAWRILGALGLAERVAALRPHAIRGMRLVAPDGTSFAGRYPAGRPAGFALRRLALDHVLLQGAREAGAEVRERVRVTDLILREGRVEGVGWEDEAGPGRSEARLVVGADGRRSRVARRLGLLRPHRSLRRFAVRGHWEGMHGLGELGEMHVAARAYCGIAPLGARTANVAFVLDEHEMAAAAGDLEGFYRATLGRWPAVRERLETARLLDPPAAIGPLAFEARAVSAPGAVLVGDAAGFLDPFTGEGVTLALRGAEMAAPILHAALASGRVESLREYDRRRHEATRDKFRFNRLLQRLLAWPSLGNAAARRLERRPDLADRLVGIAGDFVPAGTALGPRFLWELLNA